ncbi:MAG TPA: hypothetical protein PKA27_02200 [Fimbriimonadaceae bacterium]|nr:hypothetical protein [Fimbriimonadaceae bacterium]
MLRLSPQVVRKVLGLPVLWLTIVVIVGKPIWLVPVTSAFLQSLVNDTRAVISWVVLCTLLIVAVACNVAAFKNSRAGWSRAGANLALVPFLCISLMIPPGVSIFANQLLTESKQERAATVHDMITNMHERLSTLPASDP